MRKDDALTTRHAPRPRSSNGDEAFAAGPPPSHVRAARERLAEILAQPGPLPLLEATFLIAAEENEGLDVLAATARVETIGAEAARRVAGESNPFARIETVRTLLFDEIGFRGNVEQYDDPRNSYLDDVLDRKLGIPLTLSILMIEVARRARIYAEGVGLPGHFIVRVIEQGRNLLVDPFHGGHVVTVEDCRDLVVRTTGRASLFRKESLDATPPRAMLTRLLLNLKRIHLAAGAYQDALSIVDRLLLIAPGDAKEIRDRGLLLAHLGRPGAAVADLESYLSLAPQAPDADSVRGRLAWIVKKMGTRKQTDAV
jgi:regulator of sirC expression with transglutaminase-like and TPR domain